MQSLNLTTAFLITQLFLLVITFVGIYLMQIGEAEWRKFAYAPTGTVNNHLTSFVAFALISIGILIFSDDILASSQPVFSDVKLSGFSRNWAFVLVFTLDIVGAALLVFATGGSKYSPFTSMLFCLPGLAIFLREPAIHFFWYTGVVILLFYFVQGERGRYSSPEHSGQRRAFNFVSIACLIVVSTVGYATRPL